MDLLSYLNEGVVLAPRKEERKSYKEWREIGFTTPQQLDAWKLQGYEVGLPTGRWSRQVAVEVKSMRGHLVLSAWSRGAPRTWEYLADGSHFYIYGLPDGLLTKERVTFYSEQDIYRGEVRPNFTDVRVNNHTVRDTTQVLPDADIIVWGDKHVVPLPRRYVGQRFEEVRPPSALAYLGGLPPAPNWLAVALEANTVPVTEDETAGDDLFADVAFFLSRNTIPLAGAKMRTRTIYETYVQESFEAGHEPRSERDLVRGMKRQGFVTDRRKVKGGRVPFTFGLAPLPLSRLDEILRG